MRHLLSEGGELEDVERLVETGGVLVDVDHHGHATRTTEEELQEVGELGLPEGNMMLEPARRAQSEAAVPWSGQADGRTRIILGVLVEPHGADALPERQQGAVDVPRLLQPLSGVVGSGAALGAGQVAQSQPADGNTSQTENGGPAGERREEDLLADSEDSGNSDVVDPEDPDGEDAVAAETDAAG